MPGAKGRSGGKRGGGRPRKPAAHKPRPFAMPWAAIRAAAEAGSPELELIRAFAIPEHALKDGGVLARFRDEVARGFARYQIQLRQTIKIRGLRSAKRSGSVNALSLQARNILDWDKQLPAQETEPDLTTARERLRDLLVKLARNRSEIEGKTITPLELIRREAETIAAEKEGS